MKKFVLLFALTALFLSCGKDDGGSEIAHSVMVNVFYAYENGGDEKIAAPSAVMLYREKVTDFDFDKSVSSMAYHLKMTLKNGETAEPAYVSDTLVGINTFKNVMNGDYTIIVFYKPDGFSFANLYYYGYKEISVSNLSANRVVFIWNEEAGKFVKK